MCVCVCMDVAMWDRDAYSRDDLIGKASVAVGGLCDFKPRQEWYVSDCVYIYIYMRMYVDMDVEMWAMLMI